MAYLVAGGQTIGVSIGAPQRRLVSVGSVRRAYSGVPRSSVRAYFNEWPVETKWIPRSTENTVITALKASTPVTMTGDMAGSVSGCVENIRRVEVGRKMFAGVNTEAVRLGFDLLETTPVA